MKSLGRGSSRPGGREDSAGRVGRGVLEIMAAANIYTTQKYGPDRVDRVLAHPGHVDAQLRRRLALPPADGRGEPQLLRLVLRSPAVLTGSLGRADRRVPESASWYEAKYIVVMGSNLNMTRTPDVHFAAEARHNGTKLVVFSPDLSQVSRYADWWIPAHAGQDGAFWMAANHVILKEFHADRQVPYFTGLPEALLRLSVPRDARRRAPMDGSRRACFVPAIWMVRVGRGERRFQVPRSRRSRSGELKLPQGNVWDSVGMKRAGKWNLDLEGRPWTTRRSSRCSRCWIDSDEVLQVVFSDFAAEMPAEPRRAGSLASRRP